MAHITFLSLSGAVIPNNSLNNLFTDCRTDNSAEVAFVQCVNNTNGTLTASKVYLSIDSRGAVVSVAVADGTARNNDYNYGSPGAPGTWAIPTDYASGLALPNLAPTQKCLIAIKRDPSGGSAAYPERNAIIVQSTGPA